MLQKERICYTYDNTEMEGLLVFEKDASRPGPGVLVLHEYTGIDDHIIRQAETLARYGYMAFVADIYGKKAYPLTAAKAREVYRPFREDRRLLRERAWAGFRILAGLPGVDKEKLGCIGFSLGGCAALELARSGAGLKAVVSVYGYLDTPEKAGRYQIESRILVLHGAWDTVVPRDDLFDFVEEMTAAEANCQVTVFTAAAHGFCNADYRTRSTGNNSYCHATEKRAWKAIRSFFKETLQSASG